MRLRESRIAFQSENKRLRRARRLFIYLNRRALNTNTGLRQMEEAMHKHGLYSESTPAKQVRWHCARELWRIEGGTNRYYPSPDDWWRWCERNQWTKDGFWITETRQKIATLQLNPLNPSL